MSRSEKPPRTLTRKGSVRLNMAWATDLSDTGSLKPYVRTVASAAAPQLVSHCCTTTPSRRISSRDRTDSAPTLGERAKKTAAPATIHARANSRKDGMKRYCRLTPVVADVGGSISSRYLYPSTH